MTTTPAPTLEELAAPEALRLLAGVPVGRVVFTEGALPAIRPVHFVTDDDGAVVFRIIHDPRLAAALHNTVVAFEADEYDAGVGTGWSVTATGEATRIDGVAEATRLTARLPVPWTDDTVLFRVRPEIVTGRRLRY